MSPGLATGLRDRLEDAAAGALHDLDPPRDVGGLVLSTVVEPADALHLGAVLSVLDDTRTPAALVGAGTKLWLGNPLRGARVIVSTLGLVGVDELDEADGVVRVGAGTETAVLARLAEAAGWRSPLDAPGRAGTVGGALATALAGPRRIGLGPARDAVLGLDTVLTTGERTRCGARVVKNVTGYDLAKLYVGSLGTLGVLERAWLRLRALPETTRVLHASLDARDQSLALACARRPSASAVALIDEPLATRVKALGDAPRSGARHRLVVEWAGDGAVTDRDAAWLATQCKAEEAPPGAIEGLRALQSVSDRLGVRVRVHARPSSLERVCAALERGGARVAVWPVPGSVTAWFEARDDDGEDPWWLDRVSGLIDELRVAGPCEAVVESSPAWGAGRRDVFGGAPGLGLMRDLKARFDPHGILNPGRFVGTM